MDISKILSPHNLTRFVPRKTMPKCNNCGRDADLNFEAALTDLHTMKPIRQVSFVCYSCFEDNETAYKIGKNMRRLK